MIKAFMTGNVIRKTRRIGSIITYIDFDTLKTRNVIASIRDEIAMLKMKEISNISNESIVTGMDLNGNNIKDYDYLLINTQNEDKVINTKKLIIDTRITHKNGRKEIVYILVDIDGKVDIVKEKDLQSNYLDIREKRNDS